jgi:hypothetical protein
VVRSVDLAPAPLHEVPEQVPSPEARHSRDQDSQGSYRSLQ